MEREEICISYDLPGKSIAFYNVATKNRIRYQTSNCHHLLNVVKLINESGALLHWPRYCHPLRIFIENLGNMSKGGFTSKEMVDKAIQDNWKSMWETMNYRSQIKRAA